MWKTLSITNFDTQYIGNNLIFNTNDSEAVCQQLADAYGHIYDCTLTTCHYMVVTNPSSQFTFYRVFVDGKLVDSVELIPLQEL